MEKETVTIPIDTNKALVFEADTTSKYDVGFAGLCKEVAATKPESIQDFFIRLNNLQKRQQ